MSVNADAIEVHRDRYLRAILDGQRHDALTAAHEMLRAGYTVQDIYCDVLQPAQYEVGALWERNEITVAQEHMATAITQLVVAQLYAQLPAAETRRGRALISGVEGELHQLGANMVADMLEADGWHVRFLGTQTPTRDILRAIDDFQPHVIGLSATMLFNLRTVADLIEKTRQNASAGTCVVVGGGAFRHQPGVWREIGADGCALDLRSAVTAVRELTGGMAGAAPAAAGSSTATVRAPGPPSGLPVPQSHRAAT